MKEKLFTGWNLPRIARLFLGVSGIIISFEPGMLIWLPVAAYITWTGIFNSSCVDTECKIKDQEEYK